MRRSAGFTLIELSIVISILVVLTTAGLAAFVNFSRSQSLQTAAYDLSTTLNLAKSRAFSQVKPDQGYDNSGMLIVEPCVSQPLDGYKVLIHKASSSYELVAVCSGENFYIQSRVNFPTNVTVSSDTTSLSFFFPVISGGVVGSGKVVLSLSDSSQERTIIVDSNGIVR